MRSIKAVFKRKRIWDETQEIENPHLRDAILEVVENQLHDNDPPETRETFQRLLAETYTEEEAKKTHWLCGHRRDFRCSSKATRV